MELDDVLDFIDGEVSAFEIGTKVVDPSETTTLTATKKSGSFRERSPAAFAVNMNIGDEPLVFLLGPRTFVGVNLFTAQ